MRWERGVAQSCLGGRRIKHHRKRKRKKRKKEIKIKKRRRQWRRGAGGGEGGGERHANGSVSLLAEHGRLPDAKAVPIGHAWVEALQRKRQGEGNWRSKRQSRRATYLLVAHRLAGRATGDVLRAGDGVLVTLLRSRKKVGPPAAKLGAELGLAVALGVEPFQEGGDLGEAKSAKM